MQLRRQAEADPAASAVCAVTTLGLKTTNRRSTFGYTQPMLREPGLS